MNCGGTEDGVRPLRMFITIDAARIFGWRSHDSPSATPPGSDRIHRLTRHKRVALPASPGQPANRLANPNRSAGLKLCSVYM